MTPALPNTSESESARDRWLDRQERLIASLRVQPFLLVVRPSPVDLDQSDPALRSALLDQLATLEAAGLLSGWVRSDAALGQHGVKLSSNE